MCGRAGTRKKRKKLVITVNSAKFTRARAEPSARARDALLIPKPGITETLMSSRAAVSFKEEVHVSWRRSNEGRLAEQP